MKKMPFWLFLILFITNASTVEAGGDYWTVKVKDEIVGATSIDLKLSLLEEPRGVVAGCSSIVVHVKHQTVPFWAWLPFISTNHPTQGETMEAIRFLNKKYNTSEYTYFGYIGGGLYKEEGSECTFNSRGLRLERDEHTNQDVVFSFFDPV